MKRRVLTTILIFTILVNFSIFFTSCYSEEDPNKLPFNFTRFFYQKGSEYEDSENLFLACICFDIAIAFDPTYENLYYSRGRCYTERSKYKKAISDFTKYLSYDPDSDGAYFYRGSCYEDIGDLENAISDYSKSIELDPNDGYIYIFRGRLYLEDSKFYSREKAEKDFKRACELGHNYGCEKMNR
jgi:tetratricopeptide (TPR) repeat protein